MAMEEKFPWYKATEIWSDGSGEKTWMIENAFAEKSYAFCYLVEGRDYALLIDSILGMGNLKAFCGTLTSKPVKLVNTHAHSDHIGGNFFFDHCYLHHKDIDFFYTNLQIKKEMVFQMAKDTALEQYKEKLVMEGNFPDWNLMPIYPIYDGDIFDLGDRKIEVVEVGGHTLGSVILIDHKSRIAFSGDACNGNTLLEFQNSLPIFSYMKSLLHLKEHQAEFDKMYGGHEILDPTIIDEAIETVGRVLAGTDDRIETDGLLGGKVFLAAERVKDGYERKDGKHFNMTYLADRVFVSEEKNRVIK